MGRAPLGAPSRGSQWGMFYGPSFLASALLKSRVGDLVQFHSPKGLQEVEVELIEYLELD
jgi:hypothetical protein